MSRVVLANIPAITFYKDEVTLAKRTKPIPQLICKGKACKLYTPDVVRCTNLGGAGTEVDWKCEADLPESLRLGRVEVSCEGWSAPGDPYVLKGSCSLEYRLVEVPGALRKEDSYYPRNRVQRWFQNMDTADIAFYVLWIGVLLLILYNVFKSCWGRRGASGTSSRPSRPSNPGSGGHGWSPGGGHRRDDWGAPPPYSKQTPDTSSGEGWRPGFWTGAALGGLGATLLNNRGAPTARTEPRSWDWEQDRLSGASRMFSGGPSRMRSTTSDGRGEGPSNLGAVRRSTGFGGSNVR